MLNFCSNNMGVKVISTSSEKIIFFLSPFIEKPQATFTINIEIECINKFT